MRELLRFEKECAGLYFSGHILDGFSEHIEKLSAVSSSVFAEVDSEAADGEQTPEYENGSELVMAGIISSTTVKSTRTKQRMMFLNLEDATGEIELIAFPRILEENAHLLVSDTAVGVRGKLSYKDDEAPKLIIDTVIHLCRNGEPAEKMQTLDVVKKKDAPAKSEAKKEVKVQIKRVFLRVADTECEAYKKARLLASIFEGNTPVIFYNSSSGEYLKSERIGIELTDFVISELKALLGEENVVVK
jgi:DNA polymerase-3 subunit alpha